MNDWVSVYFDERRGGYHGRWRTPTGDRKKKVPVEFLTRHSVKPGEQSERAEKIAYRWAVEQLGKVRADRVQREAENRTIRGLFALYERKNPNNIASITITKYRERTQPLITWFDETQGLEPAQIDRASVATYIRWRETPDDTGWRPASKTIANELALLKQLLACAMEWQDETGVKSIRLAKLPRLTKTETRGIALTPEHIGALLAAKVKGCRRANADRVKRILVVGIATLLRHTTLYGLRWEWIDAKRQRLTIPGSAMKTREPLTVPIAAIALEACGPPQQSGWVFPNPVNGNRTKTIQRTLDSLAKVAKVPRTTPHDWRRTGYTLLAEAGVERNIRKILMGHATGIDVSDLYDKRMQKRLAHAVGLLDALLREQMPRDAQAAGSPPEPPDDSPKPADASSESTEDGRGQLREHVPVTHPYLTPI